MGQAVLGPDSANIAFETTGDGHFLMGLELGNVYDNIGFQYGPADIICVGLWGVGGLGPSIIIIRDSIPGSAGFEMFAQERVRAEDNRDGRRRRCCLRDPFRNARYAALRDHGSEVDCLHWHAVIAIERE
jgi:hypothetical protein